MKFVYGLFLVNVLSVNAQTNDKPVSLVHYAFDAFTNGKVRLKSGEVYNQTLNYNLLTKEMIFEQNGTYVAIAHPEAVDTVYIHERKFIPVSNAFYEWLDGSNYRLFIEHTCIIKEQGANTGFGTTNTTAATSIKSLLKDGEAYRLKLPDEYQLVWGQAFYVRKNTRYYKINNEQQILKLFPEKSEILHKWIESNKTRFSQAKDMMLLIQQIQ